MKVGIKRLGMKTARAIKRLYEIRGIKHGDTTSGATVAQLAKETGKSERTVKRLRTIADPTMQDKLLDWAE